MIQTILQKKTHTIRTCVTGAGKALPSRIVPNSEFEGNLDTTDEWIRTRTGIQERRFAEPHETTSQYAALAAERALASSGYRAEDIDLIILSTTTPDKRMPSTANIVQQAIGAHNAYGYDISVACSGFIFALASAHAQIQAGLARRALVISAEIYSSIIDFSDRNTCILFGDGAGAVVLEGHESGSLDSLVLDLGNDFRSSNLSLPRMLHNPEPGTLNLEPDASGIITVSLKSEGTGTDILTCEGGGTQGRMGLKSREAGMIRMDGKKVFKMAVRAIAERIREVLDNAGVTIDDVACVIPHQANIRIIERIARQFDCSMSKMVINLDRYGNTSSASVPIALCEAMETGRAGTGDLVLCAAAGAGFSSGAILLRL